MKRAVQELGIREITDTEEDGKVTVSARIQYCCNSRRKKAQRVGVWTTQLKNSEVSLAETGCLCTWRCPGGQLGASGSDSAREDKLGILGTV